MLAARLLQIGIARADAEVSFFQTDEPLEMIVLRITSADACFMNGGGYCVLFCDRSAGTHCDGEKGHRIPDFWRVGGLFVGGVDGHRRREGCGRRCCRRGRQRGDIRAACVRRRRSTKSSPITWAMTSTIRPGAVSTTVLVNALSTPSAVSANETPPCPDGSHHLPCGRRLLRCRRADHRHIIVGTGCRCHSPHGFGHRGPFPPSSRPACRATSTDFGYSLRGRHDISSFVVIRVRKDRQEAWAER